MNTWRLLMIVFLGVMAEAWAQAQSVNPSAATNAVKRRIIVAPQPVQPLPSPLWAPISNFWPGLTWRTNLTNQVLRPVTRPLTNSSPALPKPGLYQSVPYSCLVIVPPDHIDDGALIAPSGPVPPMPIVKPDLQLIPWSPSR